MAHNTSLEFPFYFVEVEPLGKLFYPIIQVSLKTKFGWQAFDFLVDTGADVTTLPSTFVRTLGVNTDKLIKAEMQGVGGITVKSWGLQLPIKIGDFQFTINASIVEGAGPPLLGKKDIFDNRFSLIIDSKRHVTILQRN